MKLDHYNVKITVSDPDNPGTALSATLEHCPREKLLEHPLIGLLMTSLEEAVLENESYIFAFWGT